MYSEVSYVHPVFVSKNNREEIQCLNRAWFDLPLERERFATETLLITVRRKLTHISAQLRARVRACVREHASVGAYVAYVRVLKYVTRVFPYAAKR